ncbi:cation:proton antiporter [Demequina globuliformis]|uniref:cation:proton antiporter n=1 Tax=Demequina globuliformis TaxID=676202 RepID=UPI0007864AED|nr:sodium:proton antiporter [Demequina globuliformis]
MEFLIIAVVALVAIAFATAFAPRVGIAAPLILVAIGFGMSLLPFVPDVAIDPEIILAGVLPPLLFAAGASIPATDFRREFKAISGLSVALTIISTAVLGVFFHWVIPDLSWAWSFAMGAIVSPSDPVATAIIKRLGVSPRLVSILEGESLLNDACALVLLRSAVVAATASVTVLDVSLDFVIAMALAVVIGLLVGRFNLWVSGRVKDTTANTVFTLAVPFIASIPAELVGASGLVAAVVCGLVTGNGSARALSPQVRMSDTQTWRAIELILEGAVYLIVGLELLSTIEVVEAEHAGVGFAVVIAAGALGLVLVVRAAFIAPLLWAQARRARRAAALRPHIERIRERLGDPETASGAMRQVGRAAGGVRGRAIASGRVSHERVTRHLQRTEADISHLMRAPLGPREGAVMVWAGMRGVVTVAAAQTLPTDTPGRALLVLIAYIVAVGSLVVQGGTVRYAIALLKPSRGATPQEEAAERAELDRYLDDAAAQARAAYRADDPAYHRTTQRIAVIEAKRDALIEARGLGIFSSEVLSATLDKLDAEQIRLEM